MGATQRTVDLAELARRSYDAFEADGVEVWLEQWTVPDFVWEMTPMGLGRYEGPERFKELYEEWISSYDDWAIQLEETEVFGTDVALNRVRQFGKLRASDQAIELRFVQIGVWEGSRIKLVVNHLDLEEARAAAEQLAER